MIYLKLIFYYACVRLTTTWCHDAKKTKDEAETSGTGMKKRLIIIGAGGHGRVVRDIARSNGYKRIFFLDDERKDDVETLGAISDFTKYLNTHVFFVAIGDSRARERITSLITESGGRIVTLIHPCATVSSDAKIGIGTVVMAGAVIGAGSTVGDSAIINTNSAVDHDCVIRDFSHVSVGASLGGCVTLERHVWVGAGATLINNVDVCEGCLIGAGAVVIRDIDERGTYVGVPARLMRLPDGTRIS